MFRPEFVQIQSGRHDIDRRLHAVAEQRIFRLAAWRNDPLHPVAHTFRKILYDPFSGLVHIADVKRIDVMGIIRIHRMVRINVRDPQLLGNLSSI